MKLLLSIINVLLIVMPISSQEVSYEDSRCHLKVIGGTSYSTILGESGVFWPMVGTHVDIKVSSQPVYVTAGIEYMNRGFRDNYNHSVVVPCLGSYHIKLGDNVAVNPFAGTIVGYGFDWEEWDLGLRLGCDININRWDFTMGYDIGLRRYNILFSKSRSQSFFVGVGYNFNLKIN